MMQQGVLLTAIIMVICLFVHVLSGLSFAQQKQIQWLNWTDPKGQFIIQVPSLDGDFYKNYTDDVNNAGGWFAQNSFNESFPYVTISNYDNNNNIFMSFSILSFNEIKNDIPYIPIPIPEKYTIPEKYVNYSIDMILLNEKLTSPDFELLERNDNKYSIGNYSSSAIILKTNDYVEKNQINGNLYAYAIDEYRKKILRFYYSADADIFTSKLPLVEKILSSIKLLD